MSGFVEGIDRSQSTFFPAMLDDYVAEDNLVRAVDAFVEGLDLGKLGLGLVSKGLGVELFAFEIGQFESTSRAVAVLWFRHRPTDAASPIVAASWRSPRQCRQPIAACPHDANQ